MPKLFDDNLQISNLKYRPTPDPQPICNSESFLIRTDEGRKRNSYKPTQYKSVVGSAMTHQIAVFFIKSIMVSIMY